MIYCNFFGFSTYITMLSSDFDSFISYFPLFMLFINLCIFFTNYELPNFRRKAFKYFITNYDVSYRLFCNTLYQISKVLYFLFANSLIFFLIMNACEILSNFFSVTSGMVFLL